MKDWVRWVGDVGWQCGTATRMKIGVEGLGEMGRRHGTATKMKISDEDEPRIDQ